MTQNLLSQTQIDDAKIAILGEGGVGKTSITIRYLKDRFDPSYIPTTRQDFRKLYNLDGQKGTVQLTDTGGMEEYESLYDQWIRSNDGFLVVYAIDNSYTFSKVQTIINQIKRVRRAEKTPIMVVGNKSDLQDSRQVREDQVKQLLDDEKNIRFIETSALKDINCRKSVDDCIRLILQKKNKNKNKKPKPKPKSFCFCCNIM